MINFLGGRKFLVFVFVLLFIVAVCSAQYLQGKLDERLIIKSFAFLKWNLVAYLIANQPEKIVNKILDKVDLSKFLGRKKKK